MEIINTVSEVFNITAEEYKLIEGFISHTGDEELDIDDLLFARKNPTKILTKAHDVDVNISGLLLFLRVRSVDMYFVRYLGEEEILLNG